ncbi:MAG: LemA family protein [Desulforhopalus sp.]|nr:LemA family protein [Desulforhopalus sp.]
MSFQTVRRISVITLLLLSLTQLTSCGYNSMQEKEEAVYRAWGNVESTLQRRADLIPNLVASVKGYASHEKETLEAVINARAEATKITLKPGDLSSGQNMEKFQQAQGGLSMALGRLLAVAENYPNLKANENFRDLQTQLEGTENRINVARKNYNEAVERFNSSIRTFPGSLTNSLLLHLDRKEYFKADAGAMTVPAVKF